MSDKQLTNEEVAAGLSRDDHETFEWVCNRWSKWLHYAASTLLQSRDTSRLITDYRHAAEDVAQEAFTRFWRSRQNYDPRIASVSTYLMSIAKRIVSDMLTEASRRRRAEKGEEDGPAPPIRSPLTPEQLNRFAQCFAALSQEQQILLQLGADETSFEEISQRIESFTGKRKTAGNLRVIKSRALKSLKCCMGIKHE